MKFFSSIILSALLAYGFGLFTMMPWWSFAISSFVVALTIHQTPFKSFLTAFLGVFLLWSILATIIDINNEHILSTKVAQILPLGGSFIALIILTGFIGGLVSGLAALTACYTRKA
jgi:hypothetical protein